MQRTMEALTQRITQPSLLESIENIAMVFKQENPEVALMADSFMADYITKEEQYVQ